MCLTSFLFLRVSVDHSPNVGLWTGSSLQKYNQVLFQDKVVRGREGVKSPRTYAHTLPSWLNPERPGCGQQGQKGVSTLSSPHTD